MGTHRRPRRPLVPLPARRALRTLSTLTGLAMASALSLLALTPADQQRPGPALTRPDESPQAVPDAAFRSGPDPAPVQLDVHGE